jgi:hypothetical protein
MHFTQETEVLTCGNVSRRGSGGRTRTYIRASLAVLRRTRGVPPTAGLSRAFACKPGHPGHVSAGPRTSPLLSACHFFATFSGPRVVLDVDEERVDKFALSFIGAGYDNEPL